jgi:hypothetical protein
MYLFTHSMQQSPSSEANRFSASQEIPQILWNRNFHYQWRIEGVGELGVQTPLPPKFRSFEKAEPNSQFRGKCIRNNLTRIRVSLICKLSGTLA